jgi:hypothetical protein
MLCGGRNPAGTTVSVAGGCVAASVATSSMPLTQTPETSRTHAML